MDAKINNKDKALINRRWKHLGNAEVFFYQTPLHITKSKDVWLFDAEDNKYLDVYNNVAHIGHANQDVIDAITQQSKTLNTSTRYLHESIVCLAEQLTATMPEDLNVCYFTCSEVRLMIWHCRLLEPIQKIKAVLFLKMPTTAIPRQCFK